jgi:hypothetical protein
MNIHLLRRIGNLFVLLLIVVAGYAIIKKHISVSASGELTLSSDVLAFVKASGDMLHGKNIYYTETGEKTSYVYPPFYAFMNIPLTFVSPLIVDTGWYLLNICLLGLLFYFGYEIFTARSFSSLTQGERWFYIFASILFSLRYLIRNAQDANINLVLLFLIVISIYLLQKSQRPAWTIIIGIAGAIKILPLIFLIYFAARREWKQIAFLCLGFVVATFLPVIFIGPDKTFAYLTAFVEYSRNQFSVQGLEIENFSLWGTLGRICSHSPSFEYPDDVPVYMNIANFSLPSLRYCVYLLNGLIIAFLYAITRREAASHRSIQGNIVNRSLPVTLLCMNLISILTEDHHTVTFMLVYFYLLICWKEQRRMKKYFLWMIIVSGALSLFISYDIVVPLFGKYTYMILLSYSLPVLPVGIILLILVLMTYPSRGNPAVPTTSRTS